MGSVDEAGTSGGAALPSIHPSNAGGALSLGVVIRGAAGLSVASVVGSVVAVPTSFAVARWLGPASFGKAEFVLLMYFFAGLLRTGAFEGGVRTYVDLMAHGRRTEALRARDVAVSFDTLASLVPGVALMALAFTLPDATRRLGFYLAPMAVVCSCFSSYLGGLYQADGRFSVVARANLVRALLTPVLLLGGVPTFGAPAVFVAPIIADATAVVLLATTQPRLGLRLVFDRSVARKLLRTGLPIGAVGILYWVYRMAGSTSVAIWGSPTSFGVYVFAAAPIAVMVGTVAAVHFVVMPAVWGEMAPAGAYGWVEDAQRITLFLAVVAGALTNLSQAGFGPVVRALLPHFDAAVPIFELLAFDVFLLSIAAVPTFVLESKRVNKQGRALLLWAAALAVNAAANIAVLWAGWGSLAVAANDVWIQAGVVVALFWLAWSHLGETEGWLTSLRAVGLVAAVTAAVGGLLHLLHGGSSLGPTIWSVALRLVVVAVVWVAVTFSYRRHLDFPSR